MKIWLSKNSEIPVREQLTAQIELAIASGEYDVGSKLPSTRELARRCGIHPNTVGTAYRQLAELKLIEFRKGSGFYVSELASGTIAASRRLDRLVEEFFRSAASLGFDRADVLARLRKTAAAKRSRQLVVIEPDAPLREILRFELVSAFPETVRVRSFETLPNGSPREHLLFAAMYDEKPRLEAVLGEGASCVYLRGRSVAAAMSGETRPSGDDIIAVVSGWEGFLNFAKIMLIAARIEPGRLVIRSTSDEGWLPAIRHADIVICDLLTASQLGDRAGVRPFRIVADESLAEIASKLDHLDVS